MPDLEYCVTLSRGPRRLGAGVLLTRRFVLTAGHCLRGVQLEDVVCVSLSTGEQLDARYCEPLERADLALLEVLAPDLVPFRLFDSDRAQYGDLWQSTYTPEENDPRLGGEVADPARAKAAPGTLVLPDVSPKAVRGLKFSAALPERLAIATLAARLADVEGTRRALAENRPLVTLMIKWPIVQTHEVCSDSCFRQPRRPTSVRFSPGVPRSP